MITIAAMAMTIQTPALPSPETYDCFGLPAPPPLDMPMKDMKHEAQKHLIRVRALGPVMVAQPADEFLPDDLPDDFLWGIAKVKFELLPIGRAGKCETEQSSGITSIDAASCDLIRKHFVARPVEKGGKFVTTTQHMGFAWSRKTERSPEYRACRSDGGAIAFSAPSILDSQDFRDIRHLFVDGSKVQFRLDVNELGMPTACTIVRSTAPDIVQQRVCPVAMKSMRFLPAVDSRGNLRPAKSYSIVQFVVQ